MASKHRILLPPAWPGRRADSPSIGDLKAAATPPAITPSDYVSKLAGAFPETPKLQELDPNDTRSEARLLARSASAGPSPVADFKDRENSSKDSKRSSSSEVPPERVTVSSAKPSRPRNRICIDPQLHPNQSHTEVHHPGIVPLGDFCDSGVEAASEGHSDAPQESLLDRFWHDLAADDDKGHPAQPESNPPVHPQGRMFRALTGGDICVEPVDVSGHFHAGHAPISKVKPAPGIDLTPQRPPHHGHPDPVSKVGPLIKGNFQFDLTEGTKPDVKHQPSNYWGFTTKSDKLEEVPLDKDEPPSASVLNLPKPTDEYGPPGLGVQDTTLVSDNTAVESPDKEDQLEGIHVSTELTQKPKDPDPESWLQKRTSRWLKDLLHQPEAYSSKLTQLPEKTAVRRNTVSSPNVRWGYHKDPSTSRTPKRHSVDHLYKATCDDLEHLLNNAVKLAKEAVDHFESKPDQASSRGTAHDSNHQRSGSDVPSGSRRKRRNVDSSGTLMVPVPQRMSSLLRLGEMLDKKSKRSSPADSVDKSKPVPTPPSFTRDVTEENVPTTTKPSSIPDNHCRDAERWSLDGTPSDVVNFSTQYNLVQEAGITTKPKLGHRLVHTHTQPLPDQDIELKERNTTDHLSQRPSALNLRGRSHVSLRGVQGFSLARSHPRQPIARDWSNARKRYVASVACISTAFIGVLVGIYAGLVPSIQYYIVDLNHYAILGNVLFYFGLAIPSFFFWPLPLLHGRKPFILSGLVIAMPLLFPQAISVSQIRSPYISVWR